eukprot:gene3080-6039_t
MSQSSKCNTTLYKSVWRQQTYTGKLANLPEFWLYQAPNTPAVLTNGLALDTSYIMCHEMFTNLIVFKGGRLGPLNKMEVWDTMCSRYCVENDRIHVEAMQYSGCSCSQLSTQRNETSYHIGGDFCLHNTGRLRCNILGFCGLWRCRLDDFMCPRYEYNKELVQFRTYGSLASTKIYSCTKLLVKLLKVMEDAISIRYLLEYVIGSVGNMRF